MMRVKKKSQRGSATLTVIILGSIATMIAIAVLRVGQGTSQTDMKSVRFYSAIELIKANVFAVLDNELAWKSTIAQNQAAGRMACINSGLGNCPVGAASQVANYFSGAEQETGTFYGEVIILYDASGALIYDPTLATSGFKLDGTVCSTYTKASVVSGCEIRARISWQAFCNTTCFVPPSPVVLRGAFFSPSKNPGVGKVPGFAFSSTHTDGIIPEMNTNR